MSQHLVAIVAASMRVQKYFWFRLSGVKSAPSEENSAWVQMNIWNVDEWELSLVELIFYRYAIPRWAFNKHIQLALIPRKSYFGLNSQLTVIINLALLQKLRCYFWISYPRSEFLSSRDHTLRISTASKNSIFAVISSPSNYPTCFDLHFSTTGRLLILRPHASLWSPVLLSLHRKFMLNAQYLCFCLLKFFFW